MYISLVFTILVTVRACLVEDSIGILITFRWCLSFFHELISQICRFITDSLPLKQPQQRISSKVFFTLLLSPFCLHHTVVGWNIYFIPAQLWFESVCCNYSCLSYVHGIYLFPGNVIKSTCRTLTTHLPFTHVEINAPLNFVLSICYYSK